MFRYILLLAIFTACAPLHAAAAPVQEAEGVLEEPDEGDSTSSFEKPKNEIPEGENTDIAKKSKTQAKQLDKQQEQGATMQPDKKPDEGMEAGFNTVVLQGLNKVTGHASKIEALIGVPVRFGTLEILPHSCWKSAPEERPENAALLEINEIKQGEAPERIFLGWMFSSSPGLSALEHPFYDITMIKCGKTEGGKL